MSDLSPNLFTKEELLANALAENNSLKREIDGLKAQNEDLEWSRDFHAEDADKYWKLYDAEKQKRHDELRLSCEAIQLATEAILILTRQRNAADAYILSLLRK